MVQLMQVVLLPLCCLTLGITDDVQPSSFQLLHNRQDLQHHNITTSTR